MSSKKKKASREKILKFALREFSRLGAAGTRMDAIARKAKISKGRIYYHFRDKDELTIRLCFNRHSSRIAHCVPSQKAQWTRSDSGTIFIEPTRSGRDS